jgi:hypothetical protein
VRRQIVAALEAVGGPEAVILTVVWPTRPERDKQRTAICLAQPRDVTLSLLLRCAIETHESGLTIAMQAERAMENVEQHRQLAPTPEGATDVRQDAK